MSTGTKVGYRVAPGWEQLPAGMAHKDVPDVAVDSEDRVYVLTRMDPRVIVYQPDGKYLGSWGEGTFSERPHGITIAPDDTVYVVDEGRHAVDVYSLEGDLLRSIGPVGAPSDSGADTDLPDIYDKIGSIKRGAGPYNKPTKLAVGPGGDLYISDGYGNCRVHQFRPSGELVRSWGEPGVGAGEFHLPHSIAVAADGRVFVADRENDRLQIFDPSGRFLEQWTDFHRPAGLCLRDGLVFVTELPQRVGYRTWRNGKIEEAQHGRVTVLDEAGAVLARWGGPDPTRDENFTSPHGVAVDSHGDLYVAEVTWTDGGKAGFYPPDAHTLVKWLRSE